ncbi:hypothetical protein UlMin_041532 [Ulmus minor]
MVAAKKTGGKFTFGHKNSPQIPQELQRYTYFSYLIIFLLSEIEYYAMWTKVGIHYYNGTACGNYLRVGCLSIIDLGIIERKKMLP